MYYCDSDSDSRSVSPSLATSSHVGLIFDDIEMGAGVRYHGTGVVLFEEYFRNLEEFIRYFE